MIFRKLPVAAISAILTIALSLGSCTKEEMTSTKTNPDNDIELKKGKPVSDNIKVPRGVNSIWPISGSSAYDPQKDIIADGFGPRVLGGSYDFHRGIDFPRPTGTPVYTSLRGGTVVRIESSQPGSTFERWGNWIVISYPASSHPNPDHASDFQVAYLHLSKILVAEGEKVNIGKKIAEVGKTGVGINTEHLHFEYYDGISNGLIKKAHSRNPISLLPYSAQQAIVTSQKNNDVITVNLEEIIPSYDVVEIAILPLGTSLTPTLNFEQRIGMDINNEDNNTYVDSDGTTISVSPVNFSAGDQSYFLNITFANNLFSEFSEYSVRITNAKGLVYIY